MSTLPLLLLKRFKQSYLLLIIGVHCIHCSHKPSHFNAPTHSSSTSISRVTLHENSNSHKDHHVHNNHDETTHKSTMTHKVLITGFYDWKELGTPPQLTRCRDNPSCVVLAGHGIGGRDFQGTLSQMLYHWSKSQKRIILDFKLLPVTWQDLPHTALHQYDQVIHLGLGVYDSFHRILIEEGAYNLHKGKDALRVARNAMILPSQDTILFPPLSIQKGIQHALLVPLPTPFTLSRAQARARNTYLCNATHYRALHHIKTQPKSRLKTAYFLHIPHIQRSESKKHPHHDHDLSKALYLIIQNLIMTAHNHNE